MNLVQEQLRIAAGEPLGWTQADVRLEGWAMLCRIHAEDPWRRLPSPGRLRRVRLPGGPEVRVDTYVYSECDVPGNYDSLIAKLTVWGADRAQCLARIRRAVEDFQLVGTPTNLPLLQHVLCAPAFANGRYDTNLLNTAFSCTPQRETYFNDLAVIAAMLYVRRNQMFRPSVPGARFARLASRQPPFARIAATHATRSELCLNLLSQLMIKRLKSRRRSFRKTNPPLR